MEYIALTQRVEEVPGRGERRDCLDQEWTKIVLKMGCIPLPLPNCLQEVAPLLTALPVKGVIVTGGNDLCHLPDATNMAPERDALEKKILTTCQNKNIPLLAVCRGMQMMVLHYGGTLTPLKNHVATPHLIKKTEDTIMPLERPGKVNSFHNYGVRQNDIGPHLKIVATAPDGSVEAVIHKEFPQWGIMWHPERDPYDQNDITILKRLFV